MHSFFSPPTLAKETNEKKQNRKLFEVFRHTNMTKVTKLVQAPVRNRLKKENSGLFSQLQQNLDANMDSSIIVASISIVGNIILV